jgi:regulator of cell morphogenesis and NO signaling
MIDLKDRTVADLVSENIKTAKVFKKHGIDFCCGGGVSVAKACEKNQIDLAIIENELLLINKELSNKVDYNSWDLDVLIDHIIKTHHSYVEESTPLIIQYSDKVASVHGDEHPEVIEINKLFHQVADELIPHLKKEELMLFPYVNRLVDAKAGRTTVPSAPFGSVNNPIQVMNIEHEGAGDVFKEIAKLSNNYTPPEGACNTFKALYDALDEFEQDLHLHIHLENNIVFPKASELEKSLNA